MLHRTATRPLTLGGLPVDEGTVVVVSAWATHRDSRFFPEPERFDPGRFAEGAPPIPRHAYFPFGSGPRSCVGGHFAFLQVATVVAVVAAAAELECVEDGEPAFEPGISLRVAGGLPMRVRAAA